MVHQTLGLIEFHSSQIGEAVALKFPFAWLSKKHIAFYLYPRWFIDSISQPPITKYIKRISIYRFSIWEILYYAENGVSHPLFLNFWLNSIVSWTFLQLERFYRGADAVFSSICRGNWCKAGFEFCFNKEHFTILSNLLVLAFPDSTSASARFPVMAATYDSSGWCCKFDSTIW